ncbi:hypothetical protein ACWD1W_15995 [Streptomyces olivaceoviridis]
MPTASANAATRPRRQHGAVTPASVPAARPERLTDPWDGALP